MEPWHGEREVKQIKTEENKGKETTNNRENGVYQHHKINKEDMIVISIIASTSLGNRVMRQLLI